MSIATELSICNPFKPNGLYHPFDGPHNLSQRKMTFLNILTGHLHFTTYFNSCVNMEFDLYSAYYYEGEGLPV